MAQSLLAANLGDTSDTQTRIVQAALQCVKRWGMAKVTLNDIAREAGVTRPTVYSYFKNRDEVIQFAMIQSAHIFSEEVIHFVERFETPEERVLEVMVFVLKRLPEEPYLSLISDTELALVMNENALLAPEAMLICRPLFEVILKGSKDIRDASLLDEKIELCVRMLLSLLSVKGPREKSDDELRVFLCRRLLPSLDLNSRQIKKLTDKIA